MMLSWFWLVAKGGAVDFRALCLNGCFSPVVVVVVVVDESEVEIDGWFLRLLLSVRNSSRILGFLETREDLRLVCDVLGRVLSSPSLLLRSQSLGSLSSRFIFVGYK